jgi:hypothetical protein
MDQSLDFRADWVPLHVKASYTHKPTISGRNLSSPRGAYKLTVDNGVWSGTPAPTFKYQWYSCKSQLNTYYMAIPGNCSKIKGATGKQLALTPALKGKFVAVLVTATSSGTTPTALLSKTTSKIA